MRPPIVVTGTPRGGTSMVAGVLAKHGCWTGETMPASTLNPTGYWENVAIKKALVEHCGNFALETEPVDGWRDIVAAILEDEGYDGGPWMVKHHATYWQVWDGMDPLFAVVRRNVEAVRESWSDIGWGFSEERLAAHLAAMDAVEKEGGLSVDADALVAGEYRTLRDLCDRAGIEFNEGVADGFIDPNLWHHS